MTELWKIHPRPLSERRILVGISTGDSIPMALGLLRRLREEGLGVQAVLGPDVTQWAGIPLLRKITGQEPLSDLVGLAAHLEKGGSLPHDAYAVVGATPRIISRLAKGIPDDAVSLVGLSFGGTILLVPSGEAEPGISSENLQCLSERGASVLLGPDGAGTEDVVAEVFRLLLAEDPGAPVLVTAGGTRERLDPVRYLGNYSSGRTGCAIARVARDAGHEVALVRGAGEAMEIPVGVEGIHVESAQDMLHALRERHQRYPILIMAAAVADYRAAELSTMKIRRDREERELKLAANPDILSALRNERRNLVTVGFAIEGGLDDEALGRAREKVENKGLDFICLNDPQRPDTAFGGHTARVRILWAERDRGVEDLPTLSKEELGREILTRALDLLARRYGMHT